MELAVATVDSVFRELGEGNIGQPPKVHLDMSRIGHESWSNAMPAFSLERRIGGIKWAGGFGENPVHALPYIMGLVVLTNPENGHAVAVMDGRAISDFRTGASAAIFARYLAAKPLKCILVVGAGVQGTAALRCLHQEFPEAELRLFDISAQKVREFHDQEAETSLGRKLLPVEDLAEAAHGAGLVVLLTTAQTPFLKNEWIEAGTTVLGMGSYQQAHDDFILSADKLVPDLWAQAAHRGELNELYRAAKIADEDCYAELSQIAVGAVPGRENSEERILGLPVGLGAHDVCLAHAVYEKAMKNGNGVFVELQ